MRAHLGRGIALGVVALVLALNGVRAARGNGVEPYTLSWWTVDSGGTMASRAGDYTLSGTLGQAEAGSVSQASATLHGGFWAGSLTQHRVFLPLVVRLT
jgi:hypothetical protein